MAIVLNGTASESTHTSGVASVTFAHTVASGTDTVLVVGAMSRDSTDADRPISGITYNGDALTGKLEINFDAQDISSGLMYRVAPDVGTFNVVVTYTGNVSSSAYAVAAAFDGVDQSTPIDTTGQTATGTSNASLSVSITTVTNGAALIDMFYTKDDTSVTVGSGQTELHQAIGGLNTDAGGSSYKIGNYTAGTTMTWDNNALSQGWCLAVIALRPAGGTAHTVDPADTATVTDAAVKNVGKNVADTSTVTDAVVKLITIALADGVTITDSATKAVGINLADTVTTADAANKNVGKNVADTSTTSDAAVKTLGKNVADIVAASDVFARVVDYARGFADGVTVTDAIAKSIGKNIADIVTVIDNATTQIVVTLTINDGVTVSDAVTKAVEKTLANNVTVSDAASKNVGKFLADVSTIVDSITKSVGKVVSDNVTITDARTNTIGKAPSDGVVTSDSAVKNVGKFIVDTVIVTDNASLSLATIPGTDPVGIILEDDTVSIVDDDTSATVDSGEQENTLNDDTTASLDDDTSAILENRITNQ